MCSSAKHSWLQVAPQKLARDCQRSSQSQKRSIPRGGPAMCSLSLSLSLSLCPSSLPIRVVFHPPHLYTSAFDSPSSLLVFFTLLLSIHLCSLVTMHICKPVYTHPVYDNVPSKTTRYPCIPLRSPTYPHIPPFPHMHTYTSISLHAYPYMSVHILGTPHIPLSAPTYPYLCPPLQSATSLVSKNPQPEFATS